MSEILMSLVVVTMTSLVASLVLSKEGRGLVVAVSRLVARKISK